MEDFICLSCNKLISKIDIIKHLQQNKDHMDFCIVIDEIRKQLSDINNNISNNSENTFSKRIESIWSELKSLSNSHYALQLSLKEISNYFKLYYDFLMRTEHFLKKPIQDDINKLEDNITNQINELKSIVNLINQNKNETNINSLEYSSIESHLEFGDTTDQYTISAIIESINKTDSYYNFFESHNNTLFYNIKNNYNISFLDLLENYTQEFNSSLINPTKLNSPSMNNVTVEIIPNNVSFKLEKIIEESIKIYIAPSVLVKNFEGLKDYYKNNYINKFKEYNSNKKVITEAIIEILRSNRVDILEYLFQDLEFNFKTRFKLDNPHLIYFHQSYSVDLLSMAAIFSNLETIKYIETLGINNNVNWDYLECLELSPLSNYICVLQYFSEKVIDIGYSIKRIFVSSHIISLGKTNMIEWISKSTPFSFPHTFHRYRKNAIELAAENGHLDIIKWLHENRTEGCTTKAIDNAAKNGHLEIIKWLHENRTEGCTNDAMNWAAENGYLEIIKWLHVNRTEGCTNDAMDFAALNGHLETIKWLHQNRTEGCTSNVIIRASAKGHLEIVKWLHHNRTEGCTTWEMDHAARNGHLETIKWLHHNRTEGCTTWAMDKAAENGHLETIKWLCENRTEGCSTKAMDKAAKNGHLGIIKWLHENRTEGCTTYAMDKAAENGHLETIKWLHYIRTEGCTSDAMDKAAKNGHLEIINWLYENRTEGCINDAMDYITR